MKFLPQTTFILLILVGLLIRFFLMATTFHPDLLAFYYSGFAFANHSVVNIYEYLHQLPLNSPIQSYGTDFFTWPPLTYFVLGILTFLLKPLFDTNFVQVLSPEQFISSPALLKHLFLLKVPYLVFDFAAAIFLVKIFSKEKEKFLAFILWIFNPVLLYSAYMIGQFDIIPTFFMILALYFAIKKKGSLSLLSLGIGGALKVFPLLFIPLAAFSLGKKTGEKLWLFALGLFPYVIMTILFLPSQAFRSVSLFGVQSQKLLFAAVNVSGADVIYLFVFFYLIFLFYFLRYRKEGSLWQGFLGVFLIIFSLTNYHPQWFLWITPFLIIFLVNYRRLWLLPAFLLVLFIGIVLLFEPSLSVGLFAPVVPTLLKFPGVPLLISKYYPPHQLASLLRSIFATISIWLIFEMFRNKRLLPDKLSKTI